MKRVIVQLCPTHRLSLLWLLSCKSSHLSFNPRHVRELLERLFKGYIDTSTLGPNSGFTFVCVQVSERASRAADSECTCQRFSEIYFSEVFKRCTILSEKVFADVVVLKFESKWWVAAKTSLKKRVSFIGIRMFDLELSRKLWKSFCTWNKTKPNNYLVFKNQEINFIFLEK